MADVDVDIPTVMAISNFTGLWVSDFSKYLKSKQTQCSDDNQFVSSNLELFGLIIYGVLTTHGFTLKSSDDNDELFIPWRCDQTTKAFIKYELVHKEYPSDWVFTVKITSLFATIYIMTINANIIHPITKLPNVQNWKIKFKLR